MALVLEGFEITISVVDNGGNKGTYKFVCDPANVPDFETAQTARTAIVTAFDAVTQCTIVGTSLKEIQYEDAIVYPLAGVELEDKASVTYQILGKNKKGNFKIPSPIPSMFVGAAGEAANQVDVQNPALTIYAGNFSSTGYFLISDGEKIADDPNNNGLIVGKRISAKNNNG